MKRTTQVGRRKERVVLETDRHLIVGDITLPPEGYQSRFSDALNRTETAFVSLTDVEVTAMVSGEVTRRSFLALGKAHIKMAYPTEEPGPPTVGVQ